MIQFRQKDFAIKGAKTNKLLAKINYVLSGSGNKAGNKFLKQQNIRADDFAARREAIKKARNTQASIKKFKHKAEVNPGHLVNDGVEFAAKNPVTAVGQAIPIPGTGIVGGAIEQYALKPVIPGYEEFGKRTAQAYRKSKVARDLASIPGPRVIAQDTNRQIAAMANRNYPQGWGK